MNIKKIKAFTLIELMVVVAIIGILASVAIPNYQPYVYKAKVTEALNIASELQAKINDYYKTKKSFPADNKAAGVPEPQYLIGHYVQSIKVENGAMQITFRENAFAGDEAQVLSIRPLVVRGSPASPIAWACGNSTEPEGMEAVGENKTTVAPDILPGACR